MTDVGTLVRRTVLSISLMGFLSLPPVELGATSTRSQHASQGHSRTQSAPGVQRDTQGRIKRSSVAKHAFKHSHPCPSTGKGSGTCPGYVIDHVHPLKRGGPDAPENMQWQTVQDAKIKDRTE